MKIKQKENSKIKINETPKVDKICFGYSYLVANKQFNFNFFKKSYKEKLKAHEALEKRMMELCNYSLKETKDMGKIKGSESFSINSFSNNFQQATKSINIISGDSKLIIFRFGEQEYRLICKSDTNHNNVLHIIGFDFDFSAYNH